MGFKRRLGGGGRVMARLRKYAPTASALARGRECRQMARACSVRFGPPSIGLDRRRRPREGALLLVGDEDGPSCHNPWSFKVETRVRFPLGMPAFLRYCYLFDIKEKIKTSLRGKYIKMVPRGVVQDRCDIRLLGKGEGEIAGTGDQWVAWGFPKPIFRKLIGNSTSTRLG